MGETLGTVSGMQEMVSSVAIAVGSGQQFGRQEGQFGLETWSE